MVSKKIRLVDLANWLIDELERIIKMKNNEFTISINDDKNLLLQVYAEQIFSLVEGKIISQNEQQPFLKGKQLCAFLGISWGTFLKLKKQGLPTIILNTGSSGMELYSKESVVNWILEQEVRA